MSLRGAYLHMHRSANALFAGQGVTADQFVLLNLLAQEDGIPQRELMARSYSDPNTITAMVRLLERRGLVRRQTPVHDRRARCVYLTAAGKRLYKQLVETARSWHQDLLDCVPASEREMLLQLLEQIAETMNPAPSRPPA